MTGPGASPTWEGPAGLRRMQQDWDRRAMEQAEQSVYSRDSVFDVEDFAASGQANYDQLVRPYLPILLEGRPASSCRAVEIGCGLGRMTRAFAAQFAEVHGVDISPAMIEKARHRLGDIQNVRLHVGSGDSLAPLPDAAFDLVFSYIVFQHIPSKPAIENYVYEAGRVLRPRGVFKFQLNGDQSPAYLTHERDSWLGETFSLQEAETMLVRYGFSLVAAEGIGTQYFVLTARKAQLTSEYGDRPYILAGEAWANAQLIEGFGEAAHESWRPMAASSRARLAVPAEGTLRFFAGIYFWPEPDWQPREVRFRMGDEVASARVPDPGDHYFEFDLRQRTATAAVEVEAVMTPPCPTPPAFRCMGLVPLPTPE